MIITKLQVAPVELVVSSESSCAVRLARHSQNAWARHVERVESRRVKWNLGYIYYNSLLLLYIVIIIGYNSELLQNACPVVRVYTGRTHKINIWRSTRRHLARGE